MKPPRNSERTHAQSSKRVEVKMRGFGRCPALALAALFASCSRTPAPAPSAPTAASPPATAAKAPAEPPASGVNAAQEPAHDNGCGALGCELFNSPKAAFERVLAEKPLVLGIGEAHARQGTENLRSTATRFGDDLLPLVADAASDIVIELMLPDTSCIKVTKQAEKKGEEITQGQAQSNQSEYLRLATLAKERNIRPHVLRPSCEQYQRVVDAGPDFVFVFMETIAKLTDTLTKAILERNQKQGMEKLVLLYGGALHNDIAPREDRKRWSYGPSLSEYTKGRYVELDLVVREYIEQGPPWDQLVWYSHFDKSAHPDQTVLYRPNPNSFVLIFPNSEQPPGK